MFSKGDDAEASRGSSAINAAISGHISLEEEERDTGKVLIVRHLKSKAGEKLPAFEIKIVKNEDSTLSFQYEGEFKSGERKFVQAKDSIMHYLDSNVGWKSANDMMKIGIASKNIVRSALKDLESVGKIKSMTRKEARDKKIDISSDGTSPRELFYRLSEAISEVTPQGIDFGDFN